MKILTPSQMIAIAAPGDVDALHSALRLSSAISAYGDEPTVLYDKWQAGEISCNTVKICEKNSFVVFWHKSGKKLVVNGVAGLNIRQKIGFDLIAESFEKLARVHGCNQIIFHTSRPGLAANAGQFGFAPLSICYGRKL